MDFQDNYFRGAGGGPFLEQNQVVVTVQVDHQRKKLNRQLSQQERPLWPCLGDFAEGVEKGDFLLIDRQQARAQTGSGSNTLVISTLNGEGSLLRSTNVNATEEELVRKLKDKLAPLGIAFSSVRMQYPSGTMKAETLGCIVAGAVSVPAETRLWTGASLFLELPLPSAVSRGPPGFNKAQKGAVVPQLVPKGPQAVRDVIHQDLSNPRSESHQALVRFFVTIGLSFVDILLKTGAVQFQDMTGNVRTSLSAAVGNPLRGEDEVKAMARAFGLLPATKDIPGSVRLDSAKIQTYKKIAETLASAFLTGNKPIIQLLPSFVATRAGNDVRVDKDALGAFLSAFPSLVQNIYSNILEHELWHVATVIQPADKGSVARVILKK